MSHLIGNPSSELIITSYKAQDPLSFFFLLYQVTFARLLIYRLHLSDIWRIF
jgi:hypothetical protein